MTSQTNNLRRRYRAVRQAERQRHTVRSATHDSGYETASNLELSMHIPPQPYGNRFEILRAQTPPIPTARHDPASSLDRRPRHIRSSRDERRRREARRNRRRLNAAQMLDEQLSRDIDRTLQQAHIQRPLPVRIPPHAPLLSYRPPSPPPSQLSHIPPAPPQLPLLNFGGLDLMDDFPPLTPVKLSPTPRTPSPMLCSIPSWCPPIPSLKNANLKFSEYPLFFDLSKLPEPTPKPKSETTYQELQIWRPLQSSQPKKHSRYFPPPTTPKPSVNLPPTRCRLHSSDEGSQDVEVVTRKVLERAIKNSRPRNDASAEASAANLWHILTSPDPPSRVGNSDPYLSSFTYKPADYTFTSPYQQYDHRLETIGAVLELDNTEIPFVHANSLTGHANERGSDAVLADGPEVFVFDTRAGVTPLQWSSFGLNELMVDHEYDDEALPPLPSSPVLEEVDTGPVITTPPREKCSVSEYEQPLSASDAQYNSEMALFDLESAAFPIEEEDLVDVATFLAMGHGSNCWCKDCEEDVPELLEYEQSTDDEGWEEYSSEDTIVSPSGDWDWDWEYETWMSEDDMEAGGRKYSGKPEWDGFVEWRTSSVAHGPW